ncbi:uncharacterized protein B0H18DRAFT_1115433 [Fomitopsis serialis]|uniref:uncharacterized protein n=1 Tax=Fomitopsis serialis TaxID=139415 RepID=UPI0020074DFF|nr:uncharacterized protein B0H18DRAFT_1115433 [Neoantrodia serialis]KAH9933431.1 hypothetical protein B0H18DRAFT_1115433 [Neoantrodia serialis]
MMIGLQPAIDYSPARGSHFLITHMERLLVTVQAKALNIQIEGQYWPGINAGAALADVAGGIDIYFLNNDRSLLDVGSKIAVRGLFQEVRLEGQTPTGQKLYEVVRKCIPKLKE